MDSRFAATEKDKNIAHSYLRWSSEPQAWGDSQRRQYENSKELCSRMGWKLSDRTFIDRGVSAWKGKNREEGALGELLKLVKPGQKIILENVDRWSREDPNDSINALRKHIDRGVEFYFGSIGRLVNRDSYKEVRVLLNLQAEMACQYSERLSHRIREAMKGKREKLAQGILPFGRLPAWLEWSAPRKHEGRKPVVVENKADAVRRIYKLYLEGKGVAAIAQAMCDMAPISNSRRSNWNGSFVYRLLKDRAVLGEYTPTKKPNIFPAIIGEDDFLRVQKKMSDNKHLTVRVRVANSNLFSGLACCASCGHTLTRLSTASAAKQYTYLVCGGRLRHKKGCTCDFHTVNYTIFERSFLSLLGESGVIYKLLSNDRVASPVENLKLKLADVRKRADQLVRVLEELEESAAGGRIGKRLTVLEAEEEQIQQQIDAALAKAKAEVFPRDAYDLFKCELAHHVHEPEGRARIRNSLRDFVDKITVELDKNQYTVALKGAGQYIQVALNKADWSFNPAPLWVADKVLYEKMDAAGELTNYVA